MGKQSKAKAARRMGADIPENMRNRTQLRCARAQQVKARAMNVSPEPSDSTEPTE